MFSECIKSKSQILNQIQKKKNLHPEESDAGQKIDSRLQIL